MWTVQKENVAYMLHNTDEYVVPQLSKFVYQAAVTALELVKQINKKDEVLLGIVITNKITSKEVDVVVGLEKLIACYQILNAIEALYRDVDSDNVRATELQEQYLSRKYDGKPVEKFKYDYEVLNDKYSHIPNLYQDATNQEIKSYIHNTIFARMDDDRKLQKLKELEEALLKSQFIWVRADSILEANMLSEDLKIFGLKIFEE